MSEKLDAEWFERLQTFHEGVPVRFRASNLAQVKKVFLEDPAHNPQFQYPLLSDAKSDERKAVLVQLQSDIESDTETHPAVKALYREKVEERLHLLQLVRSANVLSQEVTTEEQEEHVRLYTQATEAVFGKPERDLFEPLAHKILSHVSEESREKHAGAWERFSSVFTDIPPAVEIDTKPIEPSVEQDEVIRQLQLELKERGFKEWKVARGGPNRNVFAVRFDTKQMVIPHTSALKTRRLDRTLTEASFKGLIEHEMTHIARRENSKKTNLKLLSAGLAGYLRGEEGIATYREQLHNPLSLYARERMYLYAGFAYGLDKTGQSRDFKQLFSLVRDHYQLITPDFDSSVDSLAFNACFRLFRGTPCDIPGLIFTKSIVYHSGNQAIADLVAKDPSVVEKFDVGSYDPTNNKHLEALSALGIL